MVPKGWKQESISNLLERVSRPVSVLPDSKYYEIGIRSHCKGIFYKEAITGDELGNKRVFHIVPNAFVVNIVFAWEQAVARTTTNEVGMIASHRFPQYLPKANSCDVDYILYVFKTKRGKELLGLASPGGAGRNKTLGQKEFDRIQLTVPPLSEQRKIAQILSTWDKAIATTERLLANKQQQKKALMQRLLTGKQRFAGFEDYWIKGTIGELVKSLDAGVSVNGDETDNSNAQYKVLKTSCVSGHYFNINEVKYVTEAIEVQRLKEPLVCDSILISRMNTPALVGANAYVAVGDENTFLPDRLWQVKPKSTRVNMRWLGYWLSDSKTRNRLTELATGTSASMKNLSKADILDLSVEIPSVSEQKQIASLLQTSDDEIKLTKQYLDNLYQQKKALMQQLLTGKRRVKVDEVAA